MGRIGLNHRLGFLQKHWEGLRPGPGSFLTRVASPEARTIRIALLLTAVACMSLGDLYMTLTYATTVGMIESNPLARLLMVHLGAGALIAFKVAMLLLTLLLLWKMRARRCAELGAWCCFVILLWLTIRWVNYNALMAEFSVIDLHMAQVFEPRWVRIDLD